MGGNNVNHLISADGDNVYVTWILNTGGTDTIFFKRSIDGGATFESTIPISNLPAGFGNLRMDTSGDNVYLVWSDGNFARSIDNGATFSVQALNLGGSHPRVAAQGDDVFIHANDFVYQSSNNGTSFGDGVRVIEDVGGIKEMVTVDNNVYFAGTFSGDILFTRSSDGGENFTNPINISNNPPQHNVHLPRTHKPPIAVYENNVYVIWRDGGGNN